MARRKYPPAPEVDPIKATPARKVGKRPPTKNVIRKLCQDRSESAVLVLDEVMNNPEESGAARVSAAKEILDRGHGKAAQPLVGSLEDAPIQTVTMSEEAFAKLAKKLYEEV